MDFPCVFAGAHSTEMIHCRFFEKRLYKFGGTDQPNTSIDPDFAQLLQSIRNNTHSPSPSPSPSPSSPCSSKSHQEQAMKMDYEGSGSGFGTLYYRSLLQGRGILFVDQQLIAGEETASWVRQYTSDVSLFRRDFGKAMMKLSSTNVLTGINGNLRQICREVDSALW